MTAFSSVWKLPGHAAAAGADALSCTSKVAQRSRAAWVNASLMLLSDGAPNSRTLSTDRHQVAHWRSMPLKHTCAEEYRGLVCCRHKQAPGCIHRSVTQRQSQRSAHIAQRSTHPSTAQQNLSIATPQRPVHVCQGSYCNQHRASFSRGAIAHHCRCWQSCKFLYDLCTATPFTYSTALHSQQSIA